MRFSKTGEAEGMGMVGLGLNPSKASNGPPQPSLGQPPKCPECGSNRVWKDGIRCLNNGFSLQRWLCRDCGYRFSETSLKSAEKFEEEIDVASQSFPVTPSPMLDPANIQPVNFLAGQKSPYNLSFPIREYVRSQRLSPPPFSSAEKDLNAFVPSDRERRVCVSEGEAKNSVSRAIALAEEKSLSEKRAAGATEKQSEADVKGKLLEYAWCLKKNGCSEKTIEVYSAMLVLLIKARCNLLDPESVKDYLAKSNKSNGWKALAVAAYTAYLKMHGGTWEPPKCHVKRRLPFIPLEREIDDLIVGCGRRTGVFLQLLKETGMRAGEALRLKWKDVDMERQLIILNETEKSGNPRIFNLSPKLISMLNALPKKTQKIFNCTYSSLKSNFFQSRRRLARKLNNPRLQQIHFHTLRHWKATMEYHKTKDILHVKEMLGHTTLDTTLLYIQLDKALFKETLDEFTVKVAKTSEEIKELLEVGFEYVCEKDGLLYFRRRR